MAYVNFITTNLTLWKRKMRQSPLCFMCKMYEETLEHVLLQYEWAIFIWFGLDVGYKVDRQHIFTLDKWIEQKCNMVRIKGDLRIRIMTIVLMACWMVWNEKCNVVFKRKISDFVTCIEKD